MKHILASVCRQHDALLRRAGMIALMAGLGGCGGSAPLFTSDGRPTTLAQCTSGDSWNNCMDVARATCNGDFDEIRRTVDSGVRSLLFACTGKRGN
ncbi:KY49.ctg7180000000016_quiver, whole genome shotgun sequence [Burkholderia multivorans]